MPPPLDPESLQQETDRVLKTVTSAEFLAQLEAVRNAPEERRLLEASLRLTPEALRAAGVDVPATTRISSRYFEEGTDASVELADTEAGRNIVNALNEARPGLLDELKRTNPDVFKKIIEQPNPIFNPGGINPSALSVCVCVGGGPACAGIGGGS